MPLLSQLLEENINEFGEYSFLIFGDQSYSNLETRHISNQFAAGLRRLGVIEGDRVLVCMANGPEVVFSYQGISRAGAIIVPVMHLLHAKEIQFILENSQSKVIVTDSDTLSKIHEAINGIADPPMIVLIDQDTTGEQINFYDLCREGDGAPEWNLSIKEEDPAVILYTSGTTGKPKGVLLTHLNLYSNALNTAISNNEERGTTLGVLPLAHVYGLTVTNCCYLVGSTIVVFSKFETEKVFKAIERYRVKGFSAVPAMIHALVASPLADRYDLSCFRKIGSGSAPLPFSLIQAFRDKFHAEVYEGYGLSEAAPIVASHREGMTIKAGSVGIPIQGVEIRIVDDEGVELPVNTVGELIVRGENVTPGYFQNPEESKNVLKEGWLYTGDLAKIDDEGYLFIVDRKKDLIIRGGFNIYPRDLEELLTHHEAVSEAAVIGVPDVRMGEEVLAFVTIKEGVEVTEADLIQYCQNHLAKTKSPRKIEFIEIMPRNGVGKILKKELRKRAEGIDLLK